MATFFISGSGKVHYGKAHEGAICCKQEGPWENKSFTTTALKRILKLHAEWLADNTKGCRADLSSANLSYANLSSANLRSANLSYANLSSADLSSANLSSADLSSADLSSADLSSADLSSANLSYANLSYANLSSANLRSANLPAPTMVLLANWDIVSDALCSNLMRYDAANHPDPSRFDIWAAGGDCPYNGIKVQRVANFRENQKLWVPGTAKGGYELMMALLNEKCKMTDDVPNE